ncbi:hypothetical protein [Burkholderia thailandensis]|uniref:hypothetical protein n=1 Tax=Burkholderia thailandensis TaxID=57975 RepID=UPI003F68B09B
MLDIDASRAQNRLGIARLFSLLGRNGTGTIQRPPAGVSVTGQPLISRTYNLGVSASSALDLFRRVQRPNDQALPQYFATAQARKPADVPLVASVAARDLPLLTADALIHVPAATPSAVRRSLHLH